jgi:hypothetical protein
MLKRQSSILPNSQIWQGLADALQTSAIYADEDCKLKDLVATFNLSSKLLI